MAKNALVTTDERYNVVLESAEQLADFLQGEIGLSPLAVGKKFESDDLVKARSVMLNAYDWVDYLEQEGTDKEKHVHFSLWAVEVVDENGETEYGYYQGGTILNKMALALDKSNGADALVRYGVKIKCEWGKTNSKNDILLISVVK